MSSGAVSAASPSRTSGTSRWQRLLQDRWMYLFMLPGLCYFLLFVYFPMLGNVIAFKNYSPFIGIRASPWVGWENFERLFTDPNFEQALVNTLQIETLQLIFAFPAPLALALLLNSLISEPIKRSIQSIVYLPHFLSWVIVIALWQQVFGGAGVINQALRDNGMDTINFMSNPGLRSSSWSCSRACGKTSAGAPSSSWPP